MERERLDFLHAMRRVVIDLYLYGILFYSQRFESDVCCNKEVYMWTHYSFCLNAFRMRSNGLQKIENCADL